MGALLFAQPSSVVSSNAWVKKYSKDFATLGDQNLIATPAFDTFWSAYHTSAAASFAAVHNTGVVFQPNNGTNWTASGSWTAPYIAAKVSDLIGAYSRNDWLAFIIEFAFSDYTVGSTLTDAQLNYGAGVTGLQFNRCERRFNVGADYGGGSVATYNNSQTALNPAVPFVAPQTALELQIRSGIVEVFGGTAFPTAPNKLTPFRPTESPYPVEQRSAGGGPNNFDPATDCFAFSAYNFSGGNRVVTLKKLDIYRVDMSAVAT